MYILLWLNITKIFAKKNILSIRVNTVTVIIITVFNIAVVNGRGERANRSSYFSPKTLDCLYVPVPPCPCCVPMPRACGSSLVPLPR